MYDNEREETASLQRTSELNNSPTLINSASYRVIPFPAESPNHPGGAAALKTDPWTLSPGNATSLKWHNNGTIDFNYTRGNNVCKYYLKVQSWLPV